MYVVHTYRYMNQILGHKVPCAAVTSLVAWELVMVFCCHSGRM
jgi:hypothetical protein